MTEADVIGLPPTMKTTTNLRPFLTQLDSASRKRPSSTGLFFDWILLVLLIVSRVEFIVFVLFLEAVGVRKYCCTAVEIGWQFCASAFSASSGSTNPRLSGLVALGFAESRQSYFRGVALSREPPKLQQAQPLLAAWDQYRALPPSCDTRRWRAELGMRHADLLREAINSSDSQASVSTWMILLCGTWYGCMAVWPCGCVFDSGMSDAIGSKKTCKTFSTEFFDWIRQSQFSVEKSRVGKALF